tara:strand:- start:540 stop:752 length:213 start_codon:yes stop_codon:yes gene_type:complete
MKYVEEQLKQCKTCNRKTKHWRNNTKSSGFMLLVHLVLIIGTMGFWLIPLILVKVLDSRIGGWSCSECGK